MELYDYERSLEILKVLVETNTIVIEFINNEWQINSGFGGVGQNKNLYRALVELALDKDTYTTKNQKDRILAIISQEDYTNGGE